MAIAVDHTTLQVNTICTGYPLETHDLARIIGPRDEDTEYYRVEIFDFKRKSIVVSQMEDSDINCVYLPKSEGAAYSSYVIPDSWQDMTYLNNSAITMKRTLQLIKTELGQDWLSEAAEPELIAD